MITWNQCPLMSQGGCALGSGSVEGWAVLPAFEVVRTMGMSVGDKCDHECMFLTALTGTSCIDLVLTLKESISEWQACMLWCAGITALPVDWFPAMDEMLHESNRHFKEAQAIIMAPTSGN